MRTIEMVDLKNQYLNIKDEVNEGIQSVLENANFINGKPVQDFANSLAAYLDAKHVIPCANGTDALQIALMALGLQPGDEVITPSFTYIATCEVLALLGLVPVFVDVHTDSFTLIPEEVEKAITAKTKAIVPVHLYGQSANMDAIMAIAKKHNLFIIEDNAQAIGGYYINNDGKKCMNGTMGDVGCTSFFPSKNLGAYGDGGAMYTNDDTLATQLKMVANHGQSVKYVHDVVGCNSRLDTLQAVILNAKLKNLNAYCDARRVVADCYNKAFANNKNITPPAVMPYSHHVYHQYTLTVSHSRNELQQYLQDKGIPSMIYYPIPSHRQKAFAGKCRIVGDLKNTEWLNERVISLPIHTEMEPEQLDYIIKNVLSFFNQ
jgi:UDP-2-acetamido-2-deoxy-ribo-hexuluronate aminotransferase